MSTREENLPVASTISLNDSIRIIQQAQSRSILYSTLVDDLNSRIVAAAQTTTFVSTAVDYVATSSDQTILVDATAAELDVTLPLLTSAVSPIPDPTTSIIITVKKIGVSQVNDIVILPTGGVLIDGAAELRLQGAAFPFVSLMSDGLNWYTI
jgi:hypothetical protein